MEVIFLNNDGRCKWLENKVIKKIIPEMRDAALNPNKNTMYFIGDWISNNNGKVGIDLTWLIQMGIPVLPTCRDLPEGNHYTIVNTGYDSVVDEEKFLLEKGIDYIDEPCPYIRKVRDVFENFDNSYQSILLCEPDHIIIKNFKSLYPDDMILVQMSNYQERIKNQQNGKPLKFIPYVTFLPSQIKTVFDFINETFPQRKNEVVKTSCLWISSPLSPVVEIDNMDPDKLDGVKDALLIIAPGSTNTSSESLLEILKNKGLNVITISSLEEYVEYERENWDRKILLVRSPIPNNAEMPIIDYIQKGLVLV